MMHNLMLVCLLYNLPGPPKITLDTGTYQLYPISKRLCPKFDPNRDTIFELYTRRNVNTSQILRIDDSACVKHSNIDFKKPTIIFFHGFLESSSSSDAVKIKNNYLKKGDYNVILVNNERLLAGPDYITAAYNAEPIGKYSAKFVDNLVEKGLSLSKLHVIGMSLGGQIAGILGKNVRSGKVSRITGLDPAGPLFMFTSDSYRLARGDAEFVDVIHTNAGIFGTKYNSGDVDIFFNGGTFQPGCDPISTFRRKPGSIAELVFCSHYQAWRIYVVTLMNPTKYLASQCNSYFDYKAGKCSNTEKTYVGVNVNKKAKGTFYIDTGVTAVDV